MKLFIATPLRNSITYDAHQAILHNTHILRDRGIEVISHVEPAHIYVDRARSICVKKFLETDCTDLLFWDDDVSCDDDAAWKILQHDKDIVGGIYPFRKDNKVDFPAVIKFNEHNNCKEEETGLVYAKIIPTGFMRIQRRVFERMLELNGTNDCVYVIRKDHEDIYSFFRTGFLFKDDNTWYGEDVAFCMWWTAMGGELFIEPRINFTHTGFKQFNGNFHEYLMGRKIQNNLCDFDKNPDGIDGWLKDDEATIIRMLASKSDSIVEIGSWKGRSTKELLENCKGKVYAVDHWNGTPTDLSIIAAKDKDIYAEFIKNVGSYQNLKVLRGNSVDVAASLNGEKFDMVFIDAGHTYEECRADIEAWLPKCKKYICGHDYSNDFPGVKRAVNEKFINVHLVNSIWWVEL